MLVHREELSLTVHAARSAGSLAETPVPGPAPQPNGGMSLSKPRGLSALVFPSIRREQQ